MVIDVKETAYKPASEVQAEAESIHHENWARLESHSNGRDVLSLLEIEGDSRFAILAGPEGFDLSNLGQLSLNPRLSIPDSGDVIALVTEGAFTELLEDNRFIRSLNPSKEPPKVFSEIKYGGGEMMFLPFKYAPIVYVTSWSNLPLDLNYAQQSVYETFHLKEELPDEDIVYYGALSGFNSGLLPRTLQSFVHPASPYLRFYPPFHAISLLILTLSLTIAFSLIFAQWAKDIVTPKEDKAQLKALKTMGLRQGGYLLGIMFQSVFPLLAASLAVLAAYHIFMPIFASIAGFSFYFAWYWYLIYFSPILLTAGFKAIQGSIEFQKQISANQ